MNRGKLLFFCIIALHICIGYCAKDSVHSLEKFIGRNYDIYATIHGTRAIDLHHKLIKTENIKRDTNALQLDSLSIEIHLNSGSKASNELVLVGALFIPWDAVLIDHTHYKAFKRFLRGSGALPYVRGMFMLPFKSKRLVIAQKSGAYYRHFNQTAQLKVPSTLTFATDNSGCFLSAVAKLNCSRNGSLTKENFKNGCSYLKKAAAKAKNFLGTATAPDQDKNEDVDLYRGGTILPNKKYCIHIALYDVITGKLLWSRCATASGTSSKFTLGRQERYLQRLNSKELKSHSFLPQFCPICLEEFRLDDETSSTAERFDFKGGELNPSDTVQTPCRHVFHFECLQHCHNTLVCKNYARRHCTRKFQCPVCREVVCSVNI